MSKAEHPVVSVVLGTYNRLPYLRLTVDSVRRELKDINHEIIVIDGGSTDGALAWLTRQKDIITIVQHNRGNWQGHPILRRSWGYFMNLGFRCAQAPYVCMLSDDTLVIPGAIRQGCQEMDELRSQGRKVGALAFWWRNWPEQESYWVGQTLGNRLFVNHGLYLKQAMADVEYLDEETFQFYCADGDFCLKLWQAGYEVLPASASYVEHFGYANMRVRVSNNQVARQDIQAYEHKWAYQYSQPDIGWLYREYADTTHTGEQYRPFYRQYCLKKALSRYFKWLR